MTNKQSGVFDGNSTHESREESRERRHGKDVASETTTAAQLIGESLLLAAEAAGIDAAALADALRNPTIAQAAIAAVKKGIKRNAPVEVPGLPLEIIASMVRDTLKEQGITFSYMPSHIAALSRHSTEGGPQARRRYTPVLLSYDRIVTDAEVMRDMAKAGAARCPEAFVTFLMGPLRPGVWVSHGLGETFSTGVDGKMGDRQVTLLYDINPEVNFLNVQTIGQSWNPGTTFVGFVELLDA